MPYSAPPMEELERALRDYALPPGAIPLLVMRLAIQANNFEVKPITLQLIQNIQFMKFPNKDANTHIYNFLEVCNTVKYNGVSDDAICLRLFPFSLKDKGKHCLNLEPPDTITTLDNLVHKFFSKLFNPTKAARMIIEIHKFPQFEGETFYEAWDRYKDLLRKCTYHGLEKWMQDASFLQWFD